MNLFSFMMPTGSTPVQREIPTPTSSSQNEPAQKSTGNSFEERVIRPRNPQAALTISSVYRAVELRAKTEAQFQMQYQRLNKEGGNFVPDMGQEGRKLNYLLQVQPNPLYSASSFIQQIVIQRLMLGNAVVYIERDELGEPKAFWLTNSVSYDITTATYSLIKYMSEHGEVYKANVPREDVLHFANTFRTPDGLWGISTIRYAIDTLSLVKTESNQALESAAKGGRVKLLLSEDRSSSQGLLSGGILDSGEKKKYAKEINNEIYSQDVVSLHGLDKIQNISMTAAEMQMVELLGMGMDDVARFFGTPRPLLMLDTNSHYTTPTNATLEYLSRTIQPDIIEIEQEFTRKLLNIYDFGKHKFHLCEQPLLRLDKEGQAKVDKLNIETGAKSVNDVRKQYDMPAVEGGDKLYLSTNLAELGSEKLRGIGKVEQQREQPKNEGGDE